MLQYSLNSSVEGVMYSLMMLVLLLCMPHSDENVFGVHISVGNASHV